MSAALRTIKRYSNRKLYDTRDSRYVTLDQISDMIRQGEDVKVVDNGSKEDLTSVTLAQIIFEEEKRKKSFLPLAALRKVIQTGGESLSDFVTQISSSAGRVFRRDDGTTIPTDGGADGDANAKGKDEHAEPTKIVREFFDGVQGVIDGWQRKLDANVSSALESMSPLAPLQKEIQGLRERILELEGKLGQIEATRDTH